VPRAPLPQPLQHFLKKPRHAVMAAVRDDGSPVTTACWYGVEPDGRVLLSMDGDSRRIRHIRTNPGVALTVLGDNWYSHVSVLGRAVEFRDDSDHADIDRLSQRYWGKPYPDRDYSGVSVLVEIERWHIYGNPAAEA
jgi:PPOX class probable F420-dependent enzyme